MFTRRDFAKFGLGTLGALPFSHAFPLSALQARAAAQPKITSTIAGVRMGFESYSLATLPHDGILDVLIGLMTEMGLDECNLMEALITPGNLVEAQRQARGPGGAAGGPPAPPSPERQAAMKAANDAVKQWRTTSPLDYFRDIRKKFDAAGIDLYAYSPSNLTAASTDEDLQRTSDIVHALGARLMTSAMPRSVAKRFVPLAEKGDLKVGLQGRPDIHSTDPDMIATPANFLEAVAYSKNYAIQLDIGDATGGGFDALQFVKDSHEHFCGLNLKDRTKDKTSMPWGQGDSHIKEVLLLIRDNHYPIHTYVDCDYKTAPDSTRIADVKRCLAYAKTVLAT
jgi:hypothetical protein